MLRDPDELHDVLQTLLALPVIAANGEGEPHSVLGVVVSKSVVAWRPLFDELPPRACGRSDDFRQTLLGTGRACEELCADLMPSRDSKTVWRMSNARFLRAMNSSDEWWRDGSSTAVR